jgi:hypothetical protein
MVGISGKRFLVSGAVVLIALFALGVLIDPHAGLSGQAVLDFAGVALAKVGVWLVLSAIFIGATFYYVYDIPLPATLGQIVRGDNPVYAISAGTLALLIFLVVFGASGDGFRDYLHQVLIKGSFSLFIGGLITVAIARFWQLGDLDAFKEGLTERHNLNYALVVAVILICVTGLIATT